MSGNKTKPPLLTQGISGLFSKDVSDSESESPCGRFSCITIWWAPFREVCTSNLPFALGNAIVLLPLLLLWGVPQKMFSDMGDVSGTWHLQQITLMSLLGCHLTSGVLFTCAGNPRHGECGGAVEPALFCRFPDLCGKTEGIISPLSSGVKQTKIERSRICL